MSEKNDPIFLKGYTTKKIMLFMGSIFLGIGASFLANAVVPYVQENQISMFVIFPVISLPLALFILKTLPKCQVCRGKTKPAPTQKASEFDNLECSKCGQMHKIDAMYRR